MKRLYRSRTDRVIAGILGGAAEVYHLDPALLRIGYVLATIFTGGPLLLVYLVAMFVIPEGPLE